MGGFLETVSDIMRTAALPEVDFFDLGKLRRAAQQISYEAPVETVRDGLIQTGTEGPTPTEEQAYLMYEAAKLYAQWKADEAPLSEEGQVK